MGCPCWYDGCGSNCTCPCHAASAHAALRISDLQPRVLVTRDELEEIAFNHQGVIEHDPETGADHLIHEGIEYVAEVRS